MKRALPSEQQDNQERLLSAVERVLGVTTGKRIFFMRRPDGWPPSMEALAFLLAYGFLWFGIERVAPSDSVSEPKIVVAIAWGACFYAGGIYLAQSTTHRILTTLRRDVIPYASRQYAEAVADTLGRRFSLSWLLSIPTLIAAISLVAAWWAVSVDTNRPLSVLFAAHPGEFIFWSVSYFAFFFVSTAGVVAARFYSCFADNLHIEKPSFYVMGAADTPLIKGLARLGTHVLIYWIMTFFLILSSMLLTLLPPDAYQLTFSSRFLFLLLAIAGFFSLGFGSVIYVSAQMRIGRTLQRFAFQQVSELQRASNALIDPLAGRSPNRIKSDAEALEHVTRWHDRILAGGHYGSRVRASISVALPVILAVLTLVIRLIGG
jgi:hypothetical protein